MLLAPPRSRGDDHTIRMSRSLLRCCGCRRRPEYVLRAPDCQRAAYLCRSCLARLRELWAGANW